MSPIFEKSFALNFKKFGNCFGFLKPNYRNAEFYRNSDFTEFPNRNRNFGRTLVNSRWIERACFKKKVLDWPHVFRSSAVLKKPLCQFSNREIRNWKGVFASVAVMLWVVAAASFAVEKSRAVTQRVAKSERNSAVGVNSVVGVASGTGFGTIVDGNNALCQEQLVLKPVVASAH